MAQEGNGAEWRATLRRELALLLLLKLAALALLWLVFFSPHHRQPADAGRTGAHLGLPASPGSEAQRD